MFIHIKTCTKLAKNPEKDITDVQSVVRSFILMIHLTLYPLVPSVIIRLGQEFKNREEVGVLKLTSSFTTPQKNSLLSNQIDNFSLSLFIVLAFIQIYL